jgi:hypothetical protein
MRRSTQRRGKLCGINGAISEMMVCTDLLAKGNQVFRAVSPASDCDLIVQSQTGELLRVEVKTVSVVSTDNAFASVDLRGRLGTFDVLALVYQDGLIQYRPAAALPSAYFKPEGPQAV